MDLYLLYLISIVTDIKVFINLISLISGILAVIVFALPNYRFDYKGQKQKLIKFFVMIFLIAGAIGAVIPNSENLEILINSSL